jgi:fibronectin-binding autotransporter adhesin
LIGVGTGNSYAGQASLVVNDGATFKVQTSLGAITGDIAILTRGLATASGTLTIGGSGTGTLVSSDTVSFGAINAPTAGATGTVNINSGGTLQTRQISAAANSNGSSYATVNFNGGTLKSADTDNSEALISGTNGLTVKLLAGGGTIDTNGQTGQTISAVISGTAGGSLTKAGAGTLILTGSNTYNGATIINGGTLALSSTGSINNTSGVSLGSGGTFDVSAISGGYTVAALTGAGNVVGNLAVSTTLAIGDSTGTTHFSGDLTLGALATYTHELTGALNTADLGNIAGDLTIESGAILDLVQLGTYTANDKFTLLSYMGILSGTFEDTTGATLADGSTFTDAGGTWMIDYNDTSAGLNGGTGTSFVTITAVPEPNALVLFGGFGWLLVLRRRRSGSGSASRMGPI